MLVNLVDLIQPEKQSEDLTTIGNAALEGPGLVITSDFFISEIKRVRIDKFKFLT